MINKDELLFVVDENNQPLKSLPRYFVHQKNLWHRTTGIWVINEKKQILCQKRSKKKDVNPGLWVAFFGGHLLAGEKYLQSAINELHEELGIQVKDSELIPYKEFASDKPNHREFQQVYFYKMTDFEFHFHIEEEEVEEIRWMDFDDVKKQLVITKNENWVHKPWDEEILKWIEKKEI